MAAANDLYGPCWRTVRRSIAPSVRYAVHGTGRVAKEPSLARGTKKPDGGPPILGFTVRGGHKLLGD